MMHTKQPTIEEILDGGLEGFPFPLDGDRMKRYDQYSKLYRGDHKSVFRDQIMSRYKAIGIESPDEQTYIALSYPTLIVNVVANLLVGSSPIISHEDTALHEELQRILNRSRYQSLLLEVVQAASYRGDACMIARQSPSGVVIEPRPAYSYHAIQQPGNCRQIDGEYLAWREGKLLHVDVYLPGRIAHRVYVLAPGATMIGTMDNSLSTETPTGIADRNTLIHLPNSRCDNDYYGVSDYDSLMPLFGEANWRFSSVARILDAHSYPKMAGGRVNRNPNGQIDLSSGYFETDMGQAPPQYITWDASLASSFEALSRVEDAIYAISEVSKTLASTVAGARYDSGRAFRMQFAQTLAKASRKRIYLNSSISETCRIALSIATGIPYDSITPPNIYWRDGLPKDTAQDVQTESTRVAAGLTSRANALQRIDDTDPQSAMAHLFEMESENERFSATPQAPAMQAPEPPEPEAATP